MITSFTRSVRRRLLRAFPAARPAWYAVSPRYRRPSGPVPLHDLISPLRFDIVIRAQMFEFLEALPAADRRDHIAVARLARTLPYGTWFREVAAKYVLGDAPTEEELEAGFAERVRKTIELFEQFERGGLDRRRPITLVRYRPTEPATGQMETATRQLETATGKRIHPRLQPDDGCHRLALLWRAGLVEVPADACWVFSSRSAAIDNTHTLLAHLPIDLGDYYRFIGLGYVSAPVDGRASLLQAVSAERGPEVLAEVARILNADEPLLDPGSRHVPH